MKLTETTLSETLKRKQVFVKTEKELVSIINDECLKRGNDADLNHIDVSAIKSFTYLFMLISNLAFDISQWDVHNATHFNRMFYKTTFSDTFDISDWDTQNAENMDGMFLGSNFNGNISKWNVKKVESMREMFAFSTFNGNISKWDVSNVKFFTDMFNSNKFFYQNITSWKLKSATNMKGMFCMSKMKEEDIKAWKPQLAKRHILPNTLFTFSFL